ncbi:MAG: hypothetical protein AB7G11_15315 [Phycisphaerales bacterium]
MRERWAQLCGRVGAFRSADEADLTFETIRTLYSNPPRAYHDLRHIESCLKMFDEVRLLADDKDAVEFAVWLHDSVYIAERPDNEERSADAAGMVAALLGCRPEFVQRVRELIAVTRHHETPARGDPAVISDIDLAILGSDPVEYEEYRRAIRDEFAFASDEQFRTGRIAFLERMLERRSIFATPYCQREYEWRARDNLESELDRLRGGG